MLTRTPHMATIEEAAATTARWRAAIEAGDVDGFCATLAPDCVMLSPITDATRFDGVEQIRALMPHVLAVVNDIRYTDDIGDEKTRALFYDATIAGIPVTESTRVRLNDDAQVTEITLWFRPMPGLAALMAGLGPRLADTPAKRAAVRAMTAPLAAMTKNGDKVAVKLVRPGTP
jgi:hypothetical protein